jgi:hypothetical protein
MTDRGQNDGILEEDTGEGVELRLGRHAIGLLRAARDVGEPTLIAQAEAVAMAVGFVLAARLPGGVPADE